MNWIVIVACLAGFAACAGKAKGVANSGAPVQIVNWPKRWTEDKQQVECWWIPEHPVAPRAPDAYSDPTYGRAYVPRREYEELVQTVRDLLDEVRGVRECLDEVRRGGSDQ